MKKAGCFLISCFQLLNTCFDVVPEAMEFEKKIMVIEKMLKKIINNLLSAILVHFHCIVICFARAKYNISIRTEYYYDIEILSRQCIFTIGSIRSGHRNPN